MRQGLKPLAWCVALALGAAGSLAAPTVSPATAASSSSTTSAKSRTALHQFTGIVTALDQTTLTVEKHGKKPRTVVFTKHAEMKTSGKLEENARVTVYYRDDGGRSIAHRVVVKPARARAPGRSR